MMKAKQHQNKFIKLIKMPIRALAKARDMYVRSMNNYADKVSYSYAGWNGYGPSNADPLPRSFSTTSTRSRDDNDDFKELVRAASTSKLSTRIDLNNHPAFAGTCSARDSNNNNSNDNNIGNSKLRKGMVPRSASVGMAKIEEDKPAEFGEIVGNNNNKKSDDIIMSKNGNKKEKFRFFPRSKTYAAGRSTNKIP